MCSSVQPKTFPGAMPLGSGGNFQMPLTYQGGAQPTFDAGSAANFPMIKPPAPVANPIKNPALTPPTLPRTSSTVPTNVARGARTAQVY